MTGRAGDGGGIDDCDGKGECAGRGLDDEVLALEAGVSPAPALGLERGVTGLRWTGGGGSDVYDGPAAEEMTESLGEVRMPLELGVVGNADGTEAEGPWRRELEGGAMDMV